MKELGPTAPSPRTVTMSHSKQNEKMPINYVTDWSPLNDHKTAGTFPKKLMGTFNQGINCKNSLLEINGTFFSAA